ncbi:hypothetical protein OTU49_016049, partial [Cherax quadricarinatus]
KVQHHSSGGSYEHLAGSSETHQEPMSLGCETYLSPFTSPLTSPHTSPHTSPTAPTISRPSTPASRGSVGDPQYTSPQVKIEVTAPWEDGGTSVGSGGHQGRVLGLPPLAPPSNVKVLPTTSRTQ